MGVVQLLTQGASGEPQSLESLLWDIKDWLLRLASG
jgi:hypothetical protein